MQMCARGRPLGGLQEHRGHPAGVPQGAEESASSKALGQEEAWPGQKLAHRSDPGGGAGKTGAREQPGSRWVRASNARKGA